MSRAKFELWWQGSIFMLTHQNKEAMYEGWLAGRESMRDEAAQVVERHFYFRGKAFDASDKIKAIEP